MITADFHTHTDFSSDSEASLASMIEAAIKLGLTRICITDHMDKNYPHDGLPFVFDPETYEKAVMKAKETYRDKIKVLYGIELGLRNEPEIRDEVKAFYDDLLSAYPFDFAIGSTHVLSSMDPYFDCFWGKYTTEKAIEAYFSSVKENASFYKGFQIYGHLDYIIRYLRGEKQYNAEEYRTVIDAALTALIENGIGIEVNCSGFKYGLGVPHPKPDIIKRYHELGGEIITIGSDAHKPEHLAYDFAKAEELLLSLGFRHYTVFEKRQPIFLPLSG